MNTDATAVQPAPGKVIWHFTMSQDGFGAGPDDRMHWAPADAVTYLDCHLAEAGRIGQAAANGKNLEVMLPSIDAPLRRRVSPC